MTPKEQQIDDIFHESFNSTDGRLCNHGISNICGGKMDK